MTITLKEALELRKAIQLFLMTLSPETQTKEIMSVTTVFPKHRINKVYKAGEIVSYGTNSVGDPQLYQILQDHTSMEGWTPDIATSLYKAIGVTEEGYPEWVQPIGTTDAYNIGDIVSYKGTLYKSTVDANVWEPNTYGWEVV